MHWLGRHRVLILAAIAVFWTGLVFGTHFTPGVPFLSYFWRGQQAFDDLLRKEGRKTETRPDIVFVGIDDDSREFHPFDDAQMKDNRALQLMAEHPFPWSREVWALLVDRLAKAGARVIMFDVIFSSSNPDDAKFHEALDRHRDKVVLGANIELTYDQKNNLVSKVVPPSSTLIPPPQMEDDRVGYIVFFPDPLDKKIRSIRYTIAPSQLELRAPRPEDKPLKALSARVMEKIGRGADVPSDMEIHLFRFSAFDAYQPVPLWQVFDEKTWHFNYHDGAIFKDKIVMIGASSQIAHDVFDTPLNPETPGPALHLHALAAAMNHEFLSPTPLWLDFLMIGIAGFAAWVLVTWLRRPAFCIMTLVGISVAYLGVARLIYDYKGIFLMTVPTLSAFLLSGMFGLGFEYTLERLEKLRTRRTLERYVSKNLVKEILENPDSYYHSMLGSRKPVTVLFSDLVGFTSLSEKAEPAALVKQLNEYLSGMVGHVFDNGGTLDKFIGDAIMAVWGNVSSHGIELDAKAAVRTALSMRGSLQKLNEGWKADGRTELGFGVGINHGDAIIGNIGSYEPHERLDPTVIGDSVNLASRLEALTRAYSVDILIGPTAADLVKDEFYLRSVARVQVKGKTKPVDVFTPIGARADSVDPKLVESLETYEAGITAFRDRDFAKAKTLFTQFLESYPEDFLTKMYLERAVEYEQTPPDPAWNAVEVFLKK